LSYTNYEELHLYNEHFLQESNGNGIGPKSD